MAETATKTVLIADDSRFFRSMISYGLSEDGIRSLVAGSGVELIEILEREMPDVDLVLLDLVMPGLNGFEVLEQLRAHSGWERLPVVVVSQFGLNQLERAILAKQGVVSVVPKASTLDRILCEVREALHPQEQERRRGGRAAFSLAITVRTPSTIYMSTCFNLSDSGMFVVLAEEDAPPPGTGVVLKFWIPGEEAIFEVPARVAWVNGAGPSFRRTHPAGFGVEFESPAAATRDAIRRFLGARR